MENISQLDKRKDRIGKSCEFLFTERALGLPVIAEPKGDLSGIINLSKMIHLSL
jgi:hypothetical protein